MSWISLASRFFKGWQEMSSRASDNTTLILPFEASPALCPQCMRLDKSQLKTLQKDTHVHHPLFLHKFITPSLLILCGWMIPQFDCSALLIQLWLSYSVHKMLNIHYGLCKCSSFETKQGTNSTMPESEKRSFILVAMHIHMCSKSYILLLGEMGY